MVYFKKDMLIEMLLQMLLFKKWLLIKKLELNVKN